MESAVDLDDAETLALQALAAGLSGKRDTVANTISCAKAFFRFARYSGASTLSDIDQTLVESFMTRAVHRAGTYTDAKPATVRNRRRQMRDLFEALQRLQLWEGPTLFGRPVASRAPNAVRPLTVAELHQVHVHSYHWLVATRRPLVVALSEAGGSALEVACVQRDDIDLANGTVRFRGATSRLNSIPSIALDALKRALDEGVSVGEKRLTVHDRLSDDDAKRSVTQELSSTMRDAGLANVPLVSGRSIRLHHARQVFRTDGIGAAARFLGARSVDVTMRSLGVTVDDL